MTYATRPDLVARFGEDEIAQREAMLPAGAVDQALADAAAELEGHLARVVTLPLATVPPLVVRLACDVARYRLLGDSAAEDARARYKDALALLGDIGAGRVSLGVAVASSASGVGLAEMASGGRVFARSSR